MNLKIRTVGLRLINRKAIDMPKYTTRRILLARHKKQIVVNLQIISKKAYWQDIRLLISGVMSAAGQNIICGISIFRKSVISKICKISNGILTIGASGSPELSKKRKSPLVNHQPPAGPPVMFPSSSANARIPSKSKSSDNSMILSR